MDTKRFHHNSKSKLLERRLTPFLDAYEGHLIERRYTTGIVSTYLGCITHFARWLNRSRLDIHRIDEAVIRRFLDVHLPVEWLWCKSQQALLRPVDEIGPVLSKFGRRAMQASTNLRLSCSVNFSAASSSAPIALGSEHALFQILDT